jgi:uncharacterized protein (TIGR02466 family)
MVTAPAQVASLFTTPLLTEVWAESASALPSLRTAILDRQRQTEGVQLSNVLGWQSDDHMPEWGGDAARRLLAHVQARGDAVTRDLDGKRPRWISNMWANVSPPGASNQTHSHPGAYWSAVYYVEDGYGGSPDRALGGELVFLDPRMPMVRAGTPDLRWRKPDGRYDSQEVWFRPTAGRVVMFPSWLMHSVRPYRGQGIRISIAMNFTPRFEAA